MYICVSHVYSTHRDQKRTLALPGTGVADSCELPSGSWKPNPGLLEEQLVLLTASRSPALTCFLSKEFVAIQC